MGCREYAARQLCRKHGKDVRQGRIPALPHWYTQPNPPCSLAGCPTPSQSRKEPLYCHAHRDQINAGRDLRTLRPKRKNREHPAPCNEQGCEQSARVKGKCTRHYNQERNPPKWPLCTEPGCRKRTKRTHCPDHRETTPTIPRREVECEVPGCGRRFNTASNVMCVTHRADLRKKGVTREHYLHLLSVTACESCGGEGRMVTDHDHSCSGHGKDRMCEECIRGRLCNGCNTALGLLGESRERILALATYLARFQ